MATEGGSDIALIQDEDMLRKMWQQTEDFGKKKEIRMRMYKLREQRLKEFYTTGEMIQTETTSKRSSTRTHTESIADQGFMTMKTKEIRDSESPTEDYHRQSNINKNYYVSSKNEESDDNKGQVQVEQINYINPSKEFTNHSFQTSMSSSVASKWESTQTIISVSEEVQKEDVNSSTKFITNEQNNEDRQLVYDASSNKQNIEDHLTYETSSSKQDIEDRQLIYDKLISKNNISNIDNKIIESITTTNFNNIKSENNSQYSDGHQNIFQEHTSTSNTDQFEPVTENISISNSIHIDNTHTSDIPSNKSEIVEMTTDNNIINELQKLDSYLTTQKTVNDVSTKSNATLSNEEKIIKKVDDHKVDWSKENTEGQYTTTYKDSYQQPRISVDLSSSHEAFAKSLRSTPERSSPSPCRERQSPERRLKSASPEKYRSSPEKSGSPPKSFKSSTRRKLSSTQTKDLSKKRSNTPTRGEKYDSSDDSECSGATHGTYDKYKGYDSKKTSFKEQTKITSTSKYGQKSPSTSPVRREKSPGYSSEGSVGKEVRKSSPKIKYSSHDSSPERSAFKPINNYRTTQTQHTTEDNKVNLTTQKVNLYDNNNSTKNSMVDVNNFIKVTKSDVKDDSNKDTELISQNTVDKTRDSKSKTIQEQFIIEEQVSTFPEQEDSESILKEPIKPNVEINKTIREKSSLKGIQQEQFIKNEKSNEVNVITRVNDVTVKSNEKSPEKEVKSTDKDNTTNTTIKNHEKISKSSNNTTVTPSKKMTSSIPSSIKKAIPTSLEKTPSKKNLIHKDSKENVLHKTVKKDLSREKVDTKIIRNDSKTLIHKNSKESITPKMVVKKPSQELMIDKKTTISFRSKLNNSETKPKTQEPIKVIEKKDSKNKLKPSISPQSSQKKLTAIKSNIEIKKNTENTYSKKIPSTIITKPKISSSTRSNETMSKVSKINSKITTTLQTQIKKTVPSNLNKTTKVEANKNVELKSKDLEDELPPDNFESDTDMDDSTEKPKYIKNVATASSSSSSSSSEDENEEGKQKIKELDDMRIKAEEEYGKKMTNKDVLLNVVVQLPQSSRESSPEYSARFGQPYCSVSDDASLPRYADVVSEPEDVNDYRLHSSRYDVVTDLDEESNVTVADRVSKFLSNVNKQEEIKTTDIPQSPQAVKKAKQMFESIAKGQIEETDINDDTNELEIIKKPSEIQEPSEIQVPSTNVNSQSSLLTRKISGASDYKTRKEFFEKNNFDNKKSNTIEKVKSLTPTSLTRSSSIKDRRASFETKAEKKIPLKDKTNVPRTKSPESKHSSPDRRTKSPSKVIKTEVIDVKVEEVIKPRRLSGSKTVKDRTANFEKKDVDQNSAKENKTTYNRHQVRSLATNSGRVSDIYTKSTKVSDTSTPERVTPKSVTNLNRSKQNPEIKSIDTSVNKVDDSLNVKMSSKSPERKVTKSPERNVTKKPEKISHIYEENSEHSRVQESTVSSRQRSTTTTVKTDVGITVKNTTTPKNTVTTKSTLVGNTDDEVQIEDIFDVKNLEMMLEKAVGYDRRRRIRAQIRLVKRELESKTGNDTTTTTRITKNVRNPSPTKSQKQSNFTVEKTEYVDTIKKTELTKQRSPSPQKPHANPVSSSRSPSPQKTLRSVEETRSPLPQKTITPSEKARSPSPKKASTTSVEKVRSFSPQKSMPIAKARSPSPKKVVIKQQQESSRVNKDEKSFRNSTVTSSTSTTTITTTNKVQSEQVSTNVVHEQNVTDLITSSYGVGPTDDNGRPLFGLRALRKTNTNQSITANDQSSHQVDSPASVTDHRGKQLFGLKALQTESKVIDVQPQESRTVRQESRTTVHQKVSTQKGGVDQLITDHKGKPLFGLKALQSIGKTDEEPIYEDMPEPPVSPQLKELVLKHEKHAKESSKLETQPRQKPKAKFRDSFILDTKDEGLYSTFQQNGFTDPNSITLRSIIKNPEDDLSNETIVKSKSQSTVFKSKSIMKSDGSGNISVTQDFMKGEVSSVNDQEPSGQLTRGHFTYQSPDDLDAQKGVAKVTTVTTTIGGKNNAGPEITEITEELNDSIDGNKVVKRSRTNDKFESIQKRFSQESFDQDSRRSSKETNGYEKTEESPRSTPRSSLVRGDSIKALQHKFQQATVSSSLKQNKSKKSDSSSTSQTEEKTVTTKVNTSKSSNGAPTSFLDNSSRVTGVQDVLTRMRNADLVVESGDTDEDIEARALLNKFLGASVILHGMEQGAKSPTSPSSKTISTTTSASLVNQVEKQRAQNSPTVRKNLNEQELDNIWDEKQLQILLESCPDYDQRRKIRARLRQIMAEQKACADVVALANTDGDANNRETNEVTTESNSTSVSNKTESGSYVKTEVHTRTTTSTNRLTKANSVSSSPFAKFQQLERQNSAPNSQSRPCYKFTDPALARSASTIKDRLLNWVKAQTKEYKDLQITNFSTSWSDGLAFCALIHHFYPEAFDYYKLKPENRRENFEIAFRVAEDEAGIAPLLDVEDMVVMRKPDWKCVFTYVQTFYRRFQNAPQAAKPSF